MSRALLQFYDKNGRPRIPGDGDLKDHVRWLELTSFSYGTTNSTSRATVGFSASHSRQEVTISFPDTGDVEESIANRNFEKGILDFFQKVGADWVWAMRYEMNEVMVSSYTRGTGSNPTATATLVFARMAIPYRNGSADQGSWKSPDSTN